MPRGALNTDRTSTTDCLRSCIDMCCLCTASSDAVGAYGMNAASEYADESSDRWNGIGSDMQNTREAGM